MFCCYAASQFAECQSSMCYISRCTSLSASSKMHLAICYVSFYSHGRSRASKGTKMAPPNVAEAVCQLVARCMRHTSHVGRPFKRRGPKERSEDADGGSIPATPRNPWTKPASSCPVRDGVTVAVTPDARTTWGAGRDG
jgi:hypothetical protein